MFCSPVSILDEVLEFSASQSDSGRKIRKEIEDKVNSNNENEISFCFVTAVYAWPSSLSGLRSTIFLALGCGCGAGWGEALARDLLELLLLWGVRGAVGVSFSSCSLTDGWEHSGSSWTGEANLRPGRVLLLAVLAESQSDASVSATHATIKYWCCFRFEVGLD